MELPRGPCFFLARSGGPAIPIRLHRLKSKTEKGRVRFAAAVEAFDGRANGTRESNTQRQAPLPRGCCFGLEEAQSGILVPWAGIGQGLAFFARQVLRGSGAGSGFHGRHHLSRSITFGGPFRLQATVRGAGVEKNENARGKEGRSYSIGPAATGVTCPVFLRRILLFVSFV